MSRSTALVALALSSSLVLGGCGSTIAGRAVAAETSSSPGVVATDEPDPGKDAEAWASEFCEILVGPTTELGEQNPDEIRALDAKGYQDYFVDLFYQAALLYSDASRKIYQLEPTPIEGAEDYAFEAQSTFDDISIAALSASDELKAADIARPEARGDFALRVADASDTIGGAAADLESKTPPELTQAFAAAPGCTS